MNRLALTAGASLLVLSAACGGSATSPSTSNPTTLTVLAASSLTDVLPEIGAAFTRDHPDADLRYSFAGSQELVAQVQSGVPADVLALAGTSSLPTLDGDIGEPLVFARNRLTIIVPSGNPAAIGAVTDLASPDVKVALAGPEVPAGIYAAEVFQRADISVTPVSEEVDVRAVVTRVALGGADAGIVYRTDAAASDAEIETVPIPDRFNVTATYPAAAVADTETPALTQDFVDFLIGDEAQALLKEYGFEAP